jgi:carboxylate-amine ligase
MTERFGIIEHQQLTCGMHVHVAIESQEHGVAAIDRIRGWLPLLIALSANSPYWQGQDTAHASYRTVVWGHWPTTGATELFGDLANYRAIIEDLLASGSILDERMAYFPARLSQRYPTVEIRVADVCTDIDHVAAVAALSRAMVDTALDEAADGLPPRDARTELLRVAAWGAARFGVSETLVDVEDRRAMPATDVIDKVLDRLRPALRANGDLELVMRVVAAILRDGNGAAQQRASMRSGGTLEAVAEGVARRT